MLARKRNASVKRLFKVLSTEK